MILRWAPPEATPHGHRRGPAAARSVLVQNRQAVGHRRLMLDAASPGLLPALAEVGRMAQ